MTLPAIREYNDAAMETYAHVPKPNIDKVGVGSTEWFGPAFHETAARKLYLALDELYYDESAVLLPLYKKLQPIVHAAVESK
jgi:hypothetical protein